MDKVELKESPVLVQSGTHGQRTLLRVATDWPGHFRTNLSPRCRAVADSGASDAVLERPNYLRRKSRSETGETASPGGCRPFPNGPLWCLCRAKQGRTGHNRQTDSQRAAYLQAASNCQSQAGENRQINAVRWLESHLSAIRKSFSMN